MEWVTKNINGMDFEFGVEWQDSRSGFNHVCDLWLGNRKIAHAKRHYINRTWEAYEFQSVMRDCVSSVVKEVQNKLIEQEKYRRNWSRLTAERRKEITTLVVENEYIKTLNELDENLQRSRWSTERNKQEKENWELLLALVEFLCA